MTEEDDIFELELYYDAEIAVKDRNEDDFSKAIDDEIHFDPESAIVSIRRAMIEVASDAADKESFCNRPATKILRKCANALNNVVPMLPYTHTIHRETKATLIVAREICNYVGDEVSLEKIYEAQKWLTRNVGPRGDLLSPVRSLPC